MVFFLYCIPKAIFYLLQGDYIWELFQLRVPYGIPTALVVLCFEYRGPACCKGCPRGVRAVDGEVEDVWSRGKGIVRSFYKGMLEWKVGGLGSKEFMASGLYRPGSWAALSGRVKTCGSGLPDLAGCIESEGVRSGSTATRCNIFKGFQDHYRSLTFDENTQDLNA